MVFNKSVMYYDMKTTQSEEELTYFDLEDTPERIARRVMTQNPQEEEIIVQDDLATRNNTIV